MNSPESRCLAVVGDEADIREIATLSLETISGWQVVAVSSGVEALGVIAKKQPDAVLLDVMMPGQDGPATSAALPGLGGR